MPLSFSLFRPSENAGAGSLSFISGTVLFFSILFFPVHKASAQTVSLNSYLATTASAQTAGTPLSELLSEVQTAIYAENGTVKSFGTNPVCLQTTASDFSRLPDLGYPVASVELLTIKIRNASELASSIDLSTLEGYDALKYVYVLSEIPASETTLSGIVRNAPGSVAVFYSIQKTN